MSLNKLLPVTFEKNRLMKLFTISILVLLTSCDYIVNLEKEGVVQTRLVDNQPFSSIEVDVPCNLVLTNQKSEVIKLEGSDCFLDCYNLDFQNESLHISQLNTSFIQKSKMATIYVNADSLKSITINSPCVLTTQDSLIIDSLSINIGAEGTYTESNITVICNELKLNVVGRKIQVVNKLSGRANILKIHIEGCTSVDASKLQVQDVSFVHQSFSDCYVNASKSINAFMYSNGEIYYFGKPTVNVEKVINDFCKSPGNLKPM